MLRHAVRLNSLSELASPSSTCSTRSTTVKVCVAYEVDGRRITHLPYHQSVLHQASRSTRSSPAAGSRPHRGHRADHLPTEATTTSPSSAEQVGVPIRLVGVGPRPDPVVPVSSPA